MGDAADDLFDAAMREQETRWVLQEACPDRTKACDWEMNDDGLFECKTCGEVTDI